MKRPSSITAQVVWAPEKVLPTLAAKLVRPIDVHSLLANFKKIESGEEGEKGLSPQQRNTLANRRYIKPGWLLVLEVNALGGSYCD